MISRGLTNNNFETFSALICTLRRILAIARNKIIFFFKSSPFKCCHRYNRVTVYRCHLSFYRNVFDIYITGNSRLLGIYSFSREIFYVINVIMYLNQIFENLQKYYTYFNTDLISFSTLLLVMYTCFSKLSCS